MGVDCAYSKLGRVVSILVLSGWQYRGKESTLSTALFGGISGIINGFAGLGSAILAIYIMALPGQASVQRSKIIIASGVIIFTITVVFSINGVMDWDLILRGILLAPTQMIGARAADLIAEAVTAMEFRASAEDIARMSHSHPTYAEAIKEAIAEEMRRDPNVFIMGEDIRLSVYGTTANLFKEFGEDRVLDTPLSENGFFGAAIGASLVGMRPIVETVTSFMWVAMDQLISQAAKMRYMFGGQATLPVVYRASMMYGSGSAAHHSDRPYPMFMNMPGIKIAVPANSSDAKGLLKTAVRDDDPVIIFEDANLYGTRGEVTDENIPFGKAQIMKEGTDCTIVGIAGSVNLSLSAAIELEKEGISAEVINPRTLVPLDKDTILNSVEKTGRLIVVDPAHKVFSSASAISSIVEEEGFWFLQSPIMKVASEQVHIPYTPSLEKLVYPNQQKVIAAVKKTME
mgnify:CR=1 FL=1